MANPVPGSIVDKKADTRDKPKLPPKFNVVAYNDEVTSMDCVVALLKDVFNKNTEDAIRIMMRIHTEGEGICGGPYSRDLAETKTQQATAYAQRQGYPLRLEPKEA